MNHSTNVKEAALRKIFGPSKRRVPEVAAEMGLNRTTLYGWVRAARNGGMSKNRKQSGMPEKFSTVLEARSLSEEDLGRWLREKGHHADQLKRWEQEIASRLEQPADDNKRETERELRDLRKELRRKEKALAEMAALVVLKKKLESTFGEEEPLI